ncbi:MAG TPA: hypothetical protein VK063_13005, partial [Beutenbergiaceae bacterium]|nr:hypothetical protein [Beutenbergiaceae bacterium]
QPHDAIAETVLDTVSPLLPEGEYLPVLLEVRPELIAPYDQRDYFTHEQLATWQPDSFWALPEFPRSFYYRTFETAVSDRAHLYEFVIPMVPPAWNDPGRVQHYQGLIEQGTAPTAVAVSTLDVTLPAGADESADYYAHWGLSHFVLDGHHKMEAAARAGRAARLLALVNVDASLADPADVAALPELLSRPRKSRTTASR